MSYKILIRDSNFKKIGEVTDFTKLELIPRFNAVGSFVLDLPTDCAAAKELIKPKYGIIVKKDNKTIMSGTVKSRKRSFSADGDNITLGGKDDNQFLASRIIYPEVNGDFASKDYDVRTGTAEEIMKQYVNFNAGIGALSERRLPLSIQPYMGLGSTVTGRGRFHNLLDFLSSIALAGGGLGFNVVQVGDSLEFQVYKPTDKTKTAFFSVLLGNMAAFDYSNEDPEGNYIVVGGGGEGEERIIKEKGDPSSIVKYGRIETFVDQRNTSEDDELNQSLDEELTEKAEKNSFNFTPIDTPQLSFNEHYGLGDKVSIILTQPNEVIDIETMRYFVSAVQSIPVQTERVRKIQEKLDVIQDIVREVKISITPDGDLIAPVVGNQDSNANAVLGIFDKMKKITKRLSNLERR